MLTVVSFFTPTYADEAALLSKSLHAVGMDHHQYSYADMGSWDANTALKPVFLRTTRAKLDGPLLYIDVDAFVHQDCTEFFEWLAGAGWDFGLHYFRGPAFGFDRTEVRDEGWWPLTGTMFVNDTVGARAVLDAWLEENDRQREDGNKAGGGQKNLQAILPELEKAHRIARLPGRYCYVFDKPWAYSDDEPRIIEHTIASREHRGGKWRRMIRRRDERKRQLERLV